MNILSTLLFLIFSLIWYCPIYKKQNGTKLSKGTVLLALLLGAIPGMIIVLILQVLLTKLFATFDLPIIWKNFIEAFLVAGVIEELVKFTFAKIVIGKNKKYQEIDYILIFGAVGLGFGICESLMDMNNILTSIVRGVFAYHVIWQYIMGRHYYAYKKTGSKFQGFIALAFPIVLHGINDFLAFMMSSSLEVDASGDESLIWVIGYIIFLLISIVITIITIRKNIKAAKNKRVIAQ